MVHLSTKNVKPRDILTSLKKQNPDNVSTIKTVYNACQKFQTVEKADKTQMQVVMSFLQCEGYNFESRTNVVTNELEDLFFAHPGSLERWRAFPHMLLIDATYKTNRYRMPLLEIVGVTATNMTFCIAFVFLHSVKMFNYTWALRELALMNASAQVCNLADLEVVLQNFPGIINYLKDVWLIPYKEMFISAWTDKYMHFGNQTTNRVECQHAKLKRCLESSHSDLVTSLSFIHQVIQSQDIAIKASIEQSKTIVQHQFNIPHFQELCGFISLHALHMILKEFERSKNAGEVSYKCGSQLRMSYGLPYDDIDCDVDLQVFTRQFKQQPRHGKFSFLRKLREIITPSTTLIREPVVKTNTCRRPSSKKKFASNTRANPSALVFVETDSPHFRELSRHSYSFGGPDSKSGEDIFTRANTTTFEFVEPDIFQFQELARQGCSSTYNYSVDAYVHQFPPILHPYIMHVQDIKPDENCGFRAIANRFGLHEDAWATIRYNLIEDDDQWTRVYNSLNFFALDGAAPIKHWMTMPNMGLLIASKFNLSGPLPVAIPLAASTNIDIFPFNRRFRSPGRKFLNFCVEILVDIMLRPSAWMFIISDYGTLHLYHWFVLVIKMSEISGFGREHKLLLQYDRDDTYNSKKTSTRLIGTRKRDCPFRVKMMKLKTADD
ncbi:uncharacterized protein LOC120008789 [Tripterygium wilfordii]|uniref:uncharacterized protein LOC120008789 n=1 Tax=Tripterygium wilfordii TaxID=458696 RepID=UPI0018F82A0A|nr:uncharacterized protein LOC120008789 [Tripterygium wilfordii]